jgi:hypothetical protein
MDKLIILGMSMKRPFCNMGRYWITAGKFCLAGFYVKACPIVQLLPV